MVIGTILMDFVWLCGLTLLTALSAATAIEIHAASPGSLGLALGIVCGLLVWLVAVALLGAVAPKPRAGATRVMGGRDFNAWVIQFLIRRWLTMPLVLPLWSQLSSVRWLTLRLLGARISFKAQMSSDVVILDPHLVTIGAGSMIGAASGISGHMMIGEKLIFAPVFIGEKVMIAAAVGILPGVTVKDGAFIEPRVNVLAYATIGEGARIGSGAIIGARAIIGAKVKVARGAVVPDDTVVADGAHFPA